MVLCADADRTNARNSSEIIVRYEYVASFVQMSLLIIKIFNLVILPLKVL